LQKKLPEMNPGQVILRGMRARGIPVVLGADAHAPERVAADYALGLRLLQAAGYSHVSLFLNRQRQEIAIEAALQSLKVGAGPTA
jgi:histidinol-phosphatase (PHP family)